MASRPATEAALQDQKNDPSFDIISVTQACRYLGVHRNTLYKMIQAGEVPAFRMMKGGPWKFSRNDLKEWMEDKQMGGLL